MTDTTTPVATKGTKAIIGAIISGVVAALGVVTTDLTTGADWTNVGTYVLIVVTGLIGAGVVGGSVYGVTNQPKANG
jgi:hypothetical protein